MNENFIPISKKVIDRKLTEYENLISKKGFDKFINRKKIEKLKIEIQALEEGQSQDVLTSGITGNTVNTSANIKKITILHIQTR